MRLSVNSPLFKDAVNKIISVVDKKNPRPILTSCLVTAANNQVSLSASDIEVSALITMEAKVDIEGHFCIIAKNFSEIIKELPNDDIQLELDPESNKQILKLDCKGVHYTLLVNDSNEFPQLNFLKDSDPYFSIQARSLQNMIQKVSHAICLLETRPGLNGIFLQSIEGDLRGVATDAHRLGLYNIIHFKESNAFLEEGVTLPRKGVHEIKKLVDAYGDQDIKINVSESHIKLKAMNNYFITVRLMSYDFPNYQSVLPTKILYEMIVNKMAFITALKRVKILANEKSNRIYLNLSLNKLIITVTNASFGGAMEEMDVKYDGRAVDISINAKYLLEALAVLEDEEISFHFNHELSPIIIKGVDDPYFVAVIMPLQN